MSDLSLTISEVVDKFQEHLHLEDDSSVLAMAGATAANLQDLDPVNLLLVGPTGSGKTEQLRSLDGLPFVYTAATMTAASLLSGTSKKERAANARGGLLREIGSFGILVAKDVTSILSMGRDARGELLSALREIDDGRWSRDVGTDGGQHLEWTGKLGFLGGVTPTIDRFHGVMGVMGQRWLLHRMPKVKGQNNQQARRALSRAVSSKAMREDLKLAMQQLFLGIENRKPVALNEQEIETLADIAGFVAACRSAVERDSRTRDIDAVADSEVPARLSQQLRGLLYGLDVLGVKRARAWEVVNKTAADCIPPIRNRVLHGLFNHGEIEGPTLAELLGYPASTVRRALEDLTAHEVVRRTKGNRADRWELSAWAVEILDPVLSQGAEEDSDPKPVLSGRVEEKNAAAMHSPMLTDKTGWLHPVQGKGSSVSDSVFDPAYVAPELTLLRETFDVADGDTVSYDTPTREIEQRTKLLIAIDKLKGRNPR